MSLKEEDLPTVCEGTLVSAPGPMTPVPSSIESQFNSGSKCKRPPTELKTNFKTTNHTKADIKLTVLIEQLNQIKV